jgi:subfamily B ATP-binding cassette protein MsbA
VTGVNEPLQRGLAAAESVFELTDQPPERDPGRATIERARGEIRFEDVTFSYSNANTAGDRCAESHHKAGRNRRAGGPSAAAKRRLRIWCRASTGRPAGASCSTGTTLKRSH